MEFSRQRVGRLPKRVEVKWDGRVLTEGFVPFPKRLIRCLPVLFSGPQALEELAVVLAIVDYRRPNVSRPPSVDYLAFIAGIEKLVFRQVLDRLVEKNWLLVRGEDEYLEIELTGLLDAIEGTLAREEENS